jgi:hypothetical protein
LFGPVNRIELFVTFDLVCVRDLLTLLDLVPEGDFVRLRANLNNRATAVLSKFYLDKSIT